MSAPRRVSNPPNPYSSTRVEWLGPPPAVEPEVYQERARSILSENDSPDVPFRWSANPYRGCQHACAYCYARPYHEYLGWGAGTDFESRLVVKVNAPELLARELASPRLRGARVALSGATDPYQPLEASFELTRRCLEVLSERRQPTTLVTKGALVRRDSGLLGRMAQRVPTRVFISIPFADDRTARALEPGASAPSQRFQTLARLSAAGVPTGVALAPLIPGLTEPDIPEILRRARAAGAERAFLVLLRLPGSVRAVFEERLREAFPARAERVLAALREMRCGPRRGPWTRMTGCGARYQAAADLFRLHARRLGFSPQETARSPSGLRQLELFEGPGR